ncbi:unnamed protein product [Vicia faba]|uniref:Uncharacterized protein n=1 Tax=Vicia faba TaxID=3906 RepID=A0AAV0YS50_VICFA|nr:unnamed protein product [Vicia faba]
MVDWENGIQTHFWLDNWLDEPLVTKFEILDIFHNTLNSKVLIMEKLVGNITTNNSNASISNFTFLKSLDISIHPTKPLQIKEVFWSPPPLGWLKCNIDGLARGPLYAHILWWYLLR